MDFGSIQLTETVTKGGCAAKLPAGQLREVLSKLHMPRPKELAVGTETLDDACLWDLGDGRYMVQTLDFFTPIVDDPRDFGAIAAANALSDVFAMGGTPKTALTIMGFPTSKLPLELIEPLLQGAIAKITEAGACLAGGHTIDDDTLKLGFSVTGFVDKKRAWTNAGAKAGDTLILTKGLGTGVITSALKSKKAEKSWIDAAIKSMTLLNDTSGLLDNIDVHAATDVTGFSLAGHGLQMAQASDVQFSISLTQLPTIPGAMECLALGVRNRAHTTNRQYVTPHVSYIDATEAQQLLTVDAQTSGGLLLAVPANQAETAVKQLRARFPLATVIGSVRAPSIQDKMRIVFEP